MSAELDGSIIRWAKGDLKELDLLRDPKPEAEDMIISANEFSRFKNAAKILVSAYEHLEVLCSSQVEEIESKTAALTEVTTESANALASAFLSLARITELEEEKETLKTDYESLYGIALKYRNGLDELLGAVEPANFTDVHSGRVSWQDAYNTANRAFHDDENTFDKLPKPADK